MLGPTKSRDLDRPIAVSLESLVPIDHFYRHLETTLDLAFVREWVTDLYAPVGRPSIDPVVFFKLQLVMFFEGLRSERQLIEIASLNLAHRWYLGYNLDERLPDHSSLTRIRQRLGLDIFRRFFEHVVDLCQDAGLVWGRELYFDATKVRANAALDSLKPRFAVDEHLRNLFVAGTDEPDDQSDEPPGETPPHQLIPDPPPDRAEENSSRHDWIAEEGRQQRDVQHARYRRIADFRMSTTDPDATLMRAKRGDPLQVGYHDHYVVDGGRARIILNVLVTPSEVMENQPMLDLLWRTIFRWKLPVHQVTGDTTYGTIPSIVAVEDAGIRAYVPLPDFDRRNDFFGRHEFVYDAHIDAYLCPRGEFLRFDTHLFTVRSTMYRADPAACNACLLKHLCTESDNGRSIKRSFDQPYIDRVRAYHRTAPFERAMRKRKLWVEPLFAEAKQWHGLRRFRLRRLWRVNSEALLIAVGQNLKRLLSWRGWRRKPVSTMASPLRSACQPHHALCICPPS